MNIKKSFVQRNQEKLLLFVYFVVMLFLASLLFQALGVAWQNSEIARPGILWLLSMLSVTLEEFAAAGFGVYIGLLLLFTWDPKKRWQGALLWIGTLSALFGLQSVGLFIPNIDFIESILWVAGGVFVGLVLGGGQRLLQTQTTEALEFRMAAKRLVLLISLVVVLGLIEYHIVFPEFFGPNGGGLSMGWDLSTVSFVTDNLLRNVVYSTVFIVVLRRFVRYDSEESFFILGPRESGKSLFLVGMYLNALDEAEKRRSDTPIRPSSDLMALVNEMEGTAPGWSVDATEATDVNELRFQYLKGRVFPKNLRISSLDYAGEYLSELPNVLMSAGSDIDDTTLRRLNQEVRLADTLIFILDLEQYTSGEGLQIEEYFDIIQAVSDKRVLLVATKADLLAEEFRETQSMEAHRYFDEFTQYVNNELQNSNQVRTLVQDTAGSQIHPVYYQTKVADDGERIPLRDNSGNVMTVGFDRVLDEVGR